MEKNKNLCKLNSYDLTCHTNVPDANIITLKWGSFLFDNNIIKKREKKGGFKWACNRDHKIPVTISIYSMHTI